MTKKLVIVESPAKARTISEYLGKDYMVESSIGHIRDLPKNAAEIPDKYKDQPWSRLGVDVDNDFKPLYVVPAQKKQHVKKLKDLMKKADELLLATDEDREGESIAWHLLDVLQPKIPVKRMVFHEITKKAIEEAAANPREIDQRLVDAQEARRILDRVYGYEVSPVLWKKVAPKLSAGRVQSVATRLVVSRERERMAFRSASYWDMDGTFEPKSGPAFEAGLATVGGKRVALGRDFDAQGKLVKEDVVLLNQKSATALADDLKGTDFTVDSVEKKPFTQSPYPPFMTSTLQQEAGRKLRFAAARTMRAAQRLYENGYITYMRTDSTSLSQTALEAARSEIKKLYGDDYCPASPRVYKKKVKNAQEAHEAIRPAGDRFQHPDIVARQVSSDEAKVYELIWKRTIASQMENAKGERVQVRLATTLSDHGEITFTVSGKTITFPGFLRAYVEGSDDPEADLADRERQIPPIAEGDSLKLIEVEPKGHETQPPARYTEASLVRHLEELGVGRPSTYASIISTIQSRGYIWKKGSALIPSFTAFAVVSLLEQHFPHLVDYAFTAKMEDDLDEIARGEEEAIPWLNHFYFGGAESPGLKKMVETQLGEIDARQINTIPLGKDDKGRQVDLRVGRYGPFLQRGKEGEDTAGIPDDIPPDELSIERATELLDAPSGDRILGVHPKTGEDVIAKAGRFGPYVQLGERESGSKIKPKTASLFSDMDLDTISFDDAVRLLSQPRLVGTHPEDGEEILAQNAKYGPYLKKGSDSRSLVSEEQIFTITVDEAVKLFAEPKKARGRQSAAPLKEIGEDPNTKKKIELKSGRFGPYVTDGEINASLRTGDTPDSVDLNRAVELLQMRREKLGSQPAKKKAAKKKTAKKKTAKKKATKKKTAKKKTAGKAAEASESTNEDSADS